MNIQYPKDLLIIDFESTLGNNDPNNEPVQFWAILLDRNTLEEKKTFSSHIQADLSGVSEERKRKKGYVDEIINNAPNQEQVANEFLEKFWKDYFLTSWAADLDIYMFRKLISSAGIPFSDFDYHIYDLWPLAFTYLLQKWYTWSFRSEEMFQAFGLQPRWTHDALEDCRYAAEVLRIITQASPPSKDSHF